MELGHLEPGLLHEAEHLLGRLVAEDPYPHHEGAQGLPDGPGGFRGDPAAGAGGEDEAQGEGPQGLGKEGVL